MAPFGRTVSPLPVGLGCVDVILRRDSTAVPKLPRGNPNAGLKGAVRPDWLVNLKEPQINWAPPQNK